MRYTLLFLLPVFFLLSCRQDNSKEISAFRSNLGTMNKETRRLLDALMIKEAGNSIAKPYREMATRLNSIIADFADTAFNGTYTDTAQIRSSLVQLKKDYLHIVDSCMRSVNHKMFLIEDSVAIWAVNFEPVYTFTSDPCLDHYLTTEKIFSAHQATIRLFISCIGSYSLYFMKITDLGYMINVCEDKENSKIKCYYRYPHRYEKMEMLSYSAITDAQGIQVKILTKSKKENDTLYLTTEKLKKGNYTAKISYTHIRREGERDVITIDFPFSAW